MAHPSQDPAAEEDAMMKNGKQNIMIYNTKSLSHGRETRKSSKKKKFREII